MTIHKNFVAVVAATAACACGCANGTLLGAMLHDTLDSESPSATDRWFAAKQANREAKWKARMEESHRVLNREYPTEGARLGVWTQDYDAVLAAAKTSGRPILLYFTRSDVKDKSPSSVLDQSLYWTFQKDTWKAWADKNLFLVAIDSPRDETRVPEKWRARNRELVEKFGVEDYPAVFVLSPSGTNAGRVQTSLATISPDRFIRSVARVLGIPVVSGPADPAVLRVAEEFEGLAKKTNQRILENHPEWAKNPDASNITPAVAISAMDEAKADVLESIDVSGTPEAFRKAYADLVAATREMATAARAADAFATDSDGNPKGFSPEYQAAMSKAGKASNALADAAAAAGVDGSRFSHGW